MLVVAQVDMSGIPFAVIDQARKVLQAQNMAPVLMVPPEMRLMRFKPISSRETERVKLKLKKQREEARRVADEVKGDIRNSGVASPERSLKLVH